MDKTTIILNATDCFIEIVHTASNPTAWIVRRSKRTFWFRKRISSDRFTSGQQALEFARRMKRDYFMNVNVAGAQERLKRAE